MSNGYKKKSFIYYPLHKRIHSGRFLNRNLPLKSLRLLLHIKIFAYVDFNLKKFSFHLKRVSIFFFYVKIIFSLIFMSTFSSVSVQKKITSMVQLLEEKKKIALK